MQHVNFLQQADLNGLIPINIAAIAQKVEYPKELSEFHNDYPLAPDKINNKKSVV